MERFKRFIKVKDVKPTNAPTGGDHGQTPNTPEERLAKFKRFLMPCLQGDKPTSSDAQPTPKPATLQALRTDIQGQGPSQSTPETGIASNNKMDSIGSTDRGEGLSETRQGEQSESERKLADLNKELADSRKKLESVEEIEDQEFDNVIKEQGKYEENSEEQKENLDKRYEEERTKYIAQMRDLYGQLEKIRDLREDLRAVEGWIVKLRNGESLGQLQLNREYKEPLGNDEKTLDKLRLEIRRVLRSERLTPVDHVEIQLDKLLALNNELTSNNKRKEITEVAINKMEEITKVAIAIVSNQLVTDLHKSIPPDKYSTYYVMERVASLPDFFYMPSNLSGACVVSGVMRGLQLLGTGIIPSKDIEQKIAAMLGYVRGEGVYPSEIPTVYQHDGFDYRHTEELVTIDEIRRATRRGYPVHIGLISVVGMHHNITY